MAAVGGKEATNDSTAISATKDSHVAISGDIVQIIGSVDTMSESSVTMNLSGENSFWYGSAIQRKETSIAVSLAQGASWIFYNSGSEDSQKCANGGELSHLTLDGGIVILDEDIIKSTYASTEIGDTGKYLSEYRTKEGDHSAVTITNLNGAGTFKIDLDWATNQGKQKETDLSDFIYITNSQEGTQQRVEFNHDKAHLGDMAVGNKLYFAKVTDGNTTFVTSADGLVENRADEVIDLYYDTESEIINEYDKGGLCRLYLLLPH